MNLNIESVEVIPIRVPLPPVFKGSHYQMKNRCTVLTRIRTADGTVGEIYNADEDEAQPEIVKIIRSELVPMVLGMDAMRMEAIWDAMSIILKDQLRARWRTMQAIACIDSAVWDLVGKATGVSLHRLWGGFRDRVPMIGIGGYYSDDPESLQEEVRFFADTRIERATVRPSASSSYGAREEATRWPDTMMHHRCPVCSTPSPTTG